MVSVVGTTKRRQKDATPSNYTDADSVSARLRAAQSGDQAKAKQHGRPKPSLPVINIKMADDHVE